MSQRRSRTLSKLFEDAFIIGILFAIPLIASFLVYIAANAFGTGPPPVGYGIQCATNAGGICTFWSVTSGTAPSMPTGLLSLLNSFLIFISLVLGIVATIKLGPSLFEAATGGNE